MDGCEALSPPQKSQDAANPEEGTTKKAPVAVSGDRGLPIGSGDRI